MLDINSTNKIIRRRSSAKKYFTIETYNHRINEMKKKTGKNGIRLYKERRKAKELRISHNIEQDVFV